MTKKGHAVKKCSQKKKKVKKENKNEKKLKVNKRKRKKKTSKKKEKENMKMKSPVVGLACVPGPASCQVRLYLAMGYPARCLAGFYHFPSGLGPKN